MPVSQSLITITIFTTLALFSQNSFADGLTDLNQALEKLNGKMPISATYKSSYLQHRGKKKKQPMA